MKNTTNYYHPFHILLIIGLALAFPQLALAQNFIWQELPPMPEPVSNNAVVAGTVGDVPYVYSFAGIDTTKNHDGIHLKSFRYNTQTAIWDTIGPLPDPNGGKIAAGASQVGLFIYIIGGYHVASNGSEISSDKVHIYLPLTDSYLADGAPIPIPIDDHVQAVWRDSLIFVVSGWSNTTNVPDVQIYDPHYNTWQVGTSTPNTADYKVFGGSGEIIGDTIYYAGGARPTFNFPLGTPFRKGYINPNDPTDITWEAANNPLALGYRMGVSTYEGEVLWFGGSDISYNYDGLAYTNNSGVPPLDRILSYQPTSGALLEEVGVLPPVMDLRGIAKTAPNHFIIAGGMTTNQQVSNKVYQIIRTDFVGVETVDFDGENKLAVRVYPNPSASTTSQYVVSNYAGQLSIYNVAGKAILQQPILAEERVSIGKLDKGIYCLGVRSEVGESYQKLIIL